MNKLKDKEYITPELAQELKANSDKLNTEAKALIGQSVTAKTAAEKANLLLLGLGA